MKRNVSFLTLLGILIIIPACQKATENNDVISGYEVPKDGDPVPALTIEERAVNCAEASAAFVLAINDLPAATQCSLLELIDETTLTDEQKDSTILNDPMYYTVALEAVNCSTVYADNDMISYYEEQDFQYAFEDAMLFEMGYENIPSIERFNIHPCDAWAAGNRNCAFGFLGCTALGSFSPLALVVCGGILWACVDANDAAYPNCVPAATAPEVGTMVRNPHLCQ